MPALAAPLAAHGVEATVAVELPLLLLVAGGAYLLTRRWASARVAAVVGFAAAVNQGVLAWALTLNFAVTASAFVLCTLAAYPYSEGFRRWAGRFSPGSRPAFSFSRAHSRRPTSRHSWSRS